MKRYLEIAVIITILFYFLYLLGYKFYFDDFCYRYSSDISLEVAEDINVNRLAKCNDSFVCEITNRRDIDNKNQLETWDCSKKRVYYFELDYYLNRFNYQY